MSKCKDILKNLLSTMINSRILSLEIKSNIHSQEIEYCKSISTITNNANEFMQKKISCNIPYSSLTDPLLSKLKSSIKEKSIKKLKTENDMNKSAIIRNSTPINSKTRNDYANSPRNSVFKVKTQRGLSKEKSIGNMKRDKSTKSLKKALIATPMSNKRRNTEYLENTKQTSKNSYSPFFTKSTSKSKNISVKNLSKIKKNENLNLSKISTNQNDISNHNKKTMIKRDSFKMQSSKKNDHIFNLQGKITNKANNALKDEVNVSNILGLDHDVTDDLIMDQKEDKFLLSDLDETEPNLKTEKASLNEIEPKLNNKNLENKILISSNRNRPETHNTDIFIEYEDIIDDRWNIFSSFLDKKDLINLMSSNKKFHKLCLSKFLACCRTENLVYDEKIKYYKEKCLQNGILTDDKSQAFCLSKGSIRAIELLNTPLYTKVFHNQKVNHDIILPFRIFFRLLNREDILRSEGDEFWGKCCNFFIRIDEKTGDILNSSVNKFDFSNENIYRISKMVTFKEKVINPGYFSKICATTGLIIFLLKDALEYIGIVSDKRTSPKQLLKLYQIFQEKAKEKVERLSKFER